MKQPMNKRLLALLGLTAVVTTGSVIAAFSSQNSIKNDFSTGSPSVELVENFNPADSWLPGENKKKEVTFTNTGSYNSLMRFKVEISLEKADGSFVELGRQDANGQLVLKELYRDFYKLHWVWGDSLNKISQDWKYSQVNPSVTTKQKDGKTVQTVVTGWFYYNKVLAPGDSTGLTLKSVEFTPDISNDGHPDDYTDYTLHVDVSGEAVLLPTGNSVLEDGWLVPTAINNGTVVDWKDPSINGDTKTNWT